jgi:G:T/U-mismatch repair DNA glycosylase
MATVVRNNFSEETHPWTKEIPRGATKLFIGTFPTDQRNRVFDFFYCSSTNRFWRTLSAIVPNPSHDLNQGDPIENRKVLLQQLNLGLTDMGRKVLRQQGSSSDDSLFPIEFMDIIQIVIHYPELDTLIVSGDTQGNSSLSWFATFCELNGISFNAKIFKKDGQGVLVMAGRSLKVVQAFSPSRLSRKTDEELEENYRNFILVRLN